VVGATVGTKKKVVAGRSTFGRMLADALKGRRMKQEDLARSLGTTQSSVSGWINGKYEPAAATVFTIERALELDPGSLSRPLGYLPVEPAAQPMSVESAIAQCGTLDDEAKVALASVYRLLVARSGPIAMANAPRYQPMGTTRDRRTSPPAANTRPRSAASGH
jgi:transcriptional regulator with XRE-family HTH domain